MWVGQGKPTNSEYYRFVQQIRNIAILFLIDLKAQSKHRDKNCPFWMYTILFEVTKWLNMNSKQDKEYGKGDDVYYFLKLLRILDTGKIVMFDHEILVYSPNLCSALTQLWPAGGGIWIRVSMRPRLCGPTHR